MKIISFINERPVIKKILEHLKLWEKQRQRPPPRAGPNPPVKPCQERYQYEHFDDAQCKLSDDGWPGYEEPYITYD